jgi:mannose-6-phosphate isomerase-like protein (cupin superfamily)
MRHFFSSDELQKQQLQLGKRYLEFLRVPAMSAGLYVLSAGAVDEQKPHNEDELYFVVRGKAQMKVGSETSDVRPGSTIFVEAKAEHKFFDITEELQVLVFFAPAESE